MPQRKLPTVWEILAVCAIIAVIAAILFPVFAKARQPHSHWSCASDQKQLGLAMLQYTQDNDGQLPRGLQGRGTAWAGQIYSYVKCVGVYFCPDDSTLVAGAASVVSYGFNADVPLHPDVMEYSARESTVLLFEVSGVKADITHRDEGASQGATAFSAAGDGTDGTLNAGHAAPKYATGDAGGRSPAPVTQIGGPRHEGGSNFVFADGHVKWLKPGQVSSGTNAVNPADGQTGVTHGTAAGTGDTNYAATFSVR